MSREWRVRSETGFNTPIVKAAGDITMKWTIVAQFWFHLSRNKTTSPCESAAPK